jgi:hypothetical protein
MPQAASAQGNALTPVILSDGQGRVFNPGGQLTAVINVSASGDTTVIAGVAGKRIYAFAFDVVSDTGQQVGFKDGTGGTVIWGPVACGATSVPGGVSTAVVPPAWKMRTTAGNPLVINLSANIHVGGVIQYWLDID